VGIRHECMWLAVQPLGSSGGMVSFPHGGGLVMSGVHGGLVAGHEDGDDTFRRRELRLLKNKYLSYILHAHTNTLKRKFS